MSETIKVGDVVPWPKVPSGALAETSGGGRFIVRIGDRRLMAKTPGDDTWGTDTWGPWNDDFATSGTIVALGLTGEETATDLRLLAEVFKVREALPSLASWPGHLPEDFYEKIGRMMAKREDWQQWAAERLHTAGWRPGMTAEDAARLLAEK